MRFSDEFFREETREGFYISRLMKCTWAAEMEILSVFEKICEVYGIRYYLGCGSLLGAVRHGGYIPWDDDLDLWMPREELNKVAMIPREVFAGLGLELYTPYNQKKYENTIYHVSNGNRIDLSKEFLQKYHGCPFHLGIDLVPLDHIPADPKLARAQEDLYLDACMLGFEWEEISEAERRRRYRSIIERTGGYEPEEWELPQRLFVIADSVMQLYDDETDRPLADMPVRLQNPKICYQPEWFGEPMKLPFEQMQVSVPREYERCIRMNYGEGYLTPIQNAGMHDYPFYRDQYAQLIRWFEDRGVEVPELYREM